MINCMIVATFVVVCVMAGYTASALRDIYRKLNQIECVVKRN